MKKASSGGADSSLPPLEDVPLRIVSWYSLLPLALLRLLGAPAPRTARRSTCETLHSPVDCEWSWEEALGGSPAFPLRPLPLLLLAAVLLLYWLYDRLVGVDSMRLG